MTGEELRTERIKVGLTQEQLAGIIEHTGTTIRNWENDRVPIPKIKVPGIKQALESYEKTGQVAA